MRNPGCVKGYTVGVSGPFKDHRKEVERVTVECNSHNKNSGAVRNDKPGSDEVRDERRGWM